jgi:hypothetical protein
VPTALLGDVPVLHSAPADRDSGQGLEAALVERRLPGLEEDLHGADERGLERTRDVRAEIRPAVAVASISVDTGPVTA